MNKLWAPWRKVYLTHPKVKGCIFCSKVRSKNDRKNLIIVRGKNAFSILNLYPYNNGHLMIVPYRHLDSPALLEMGEWVEMFDLLKRNLATLQKELKPHGYNIGMNIGRAGGAGIEKHIHLHVVPRWNGDTNFMPVVNGDKVISQSLDELWKIFNP